MSAQSETASDRPTSLLQLYRDLWYYALGGRRILVLAFLLLLGSQLFKLAIPWLAGQAINHIQRGGLAGLSEAAAFLALVFGATAASWAMHGPGRIFERNVALRVRSRLTARLMDKLLDAPLAWHEARHSGETSHRLQQSTSALYDFAQSQFVYLQNAVRLFGPVIALWLISPAVGAVAVAGYVVLGLIILRFDREMMSLAVRENEAERRYSAVLIDALGNILTIFALRRRSGVAALVAQRMHAIFEPLRRSIVLNEAKWCVVDILSSLLWCVLVALYAWLAVRGNAGGVMSPLEQGTAAAPAAALPIGNVFMVYEYAMQAGGVITAIAAHFQSLARSQSDYASGQPLLAASSAHHVDSATESVWQQIRIEALTFHHPAARNAAPALDDVALTLRRGRRYALVGPSGSGKSTLLRLLAGLDIASEGRLSIDDIAVPDAAAALRSMSTLIPQQAEMFEGSLRENLLLGSDADEEAVERALHAACANEFVATLPQGLETRVVEGGANWSGGQRQRVALARGVLAAQGSALVLLDEPTSSLDPETERRLYARTLSLLSDACVVSSVHRLHLLDRFDEVMLMREGRIELIGAPGELALHSQLFRNMLSAQTADSSAG